MQMTCPKCQAQMRQYERNSVTVDQCTECRGIFLDRGEMERLIDAENAWHGESTPPPQPQQAAPPPPPPPQSAPPPQQQPYRQPYRDYDSDEYPMYGRRGGHGHGGRKKKRGFLDELFG